MPLAMYQRGMDEQLLGCETLHPRPLFLWSGVSSGTAGFLGRKWKIDLRSIMHHDIVLSPPMAHRCP